MIPRPNPKRKRSFQHGLALASVKTPCIVSSRELTPNGASADDVSSHRLSLDRTGTIRQIIPVAAQSVARIPYVEFLDWFRSLDISRFLERWLESANMTQVNLSFKSNSLTKLHPRLSFLPILYSQQRFWTLTGEWTRIMTGIATQWKVGFRQTRKQSANFTNRLRTS